METFITAVLLFFYGAAWFVGGFALGATAGNNRAKEAIRSVKEQFEHAELAYKLSLEEAENEINKWKARVQKKKLP